MSYLVHPDEGEGLPPFESASVAQVVLALDSSSEAPYVGAMATLDNAVQAVCMIRPDLHRLLLAAAMGSLGFEDVAALRAAYDKVQDPDAGA